MGTCDGITILDRNTYGLKWNKKLTVYRFRMCVKSPVLPVLLYCTPRKDDRLPKGVVVAILCNMQVL